MPLQRSLMSTPAESISITVLKLSLLATDRNPTHFHSFGTWSSRNRWPLLVSPAKVFLQVSLIVMITRLVEKNKLKAHQYWPDDTDETEIGPEIKVSWPTHKFLLRLVLSGGGRSQDLPPLDLFPRFLLPQVSQSCNKPCLPVWLLEMVGILRSPYRKFSISLPLGETREVVQLHTEDWPDLGVPDGPRQEDEI